MLLKRMHSCETLPAPPASGPNLLVQLGRLIIRARSASPAPRDGILNAKLIAAKPSTSQQVVTQPKLESEGPRPGLEAQLHSHVNNLWNDQIPICIEVFLAPDCPECYTALSKPQEAYDKLHSTPKVLIERWTMRALDTKNTEIPAFITSQWLLNAVRSQLHFSQLSAWLARLKDTVKEDNPSERRRKLSRETCNFKKIEANCDEKDKWDEHRKLNIVYSITSCDTYKMAEFSKTPTDHIFPITDIGNNTYLKVNLESLPRIDDIPTVRCTCQKRRLSKDIPITTHEELIVKLTDLSINKIDKQHSNVGTPRRSVISNPSAKDTKLLDDRMHTPCSENGKHKCNFDEESDSKDNQVCINHQETKKIDERRLKEIAKYKRRLRKEDKLKKMCDSTSSEGDGLLKAKETHTSIPILQAARFDRFRAIGCYRNQTYLTLPASRIDTKSPFLETITVPEAEFKKTNTVSTQTDDVACSCGDVLDFKCHNCTDKGMVRSEANYNLASYNDNGARRKCEEDDKVFKKHKCDNVSSNLYCDKSSVINNSDVTGENDVSIIKRPKLQRLYPIVGRIERIVADRMRNPDDIKQLNLKHDDTVFSRPRIEKRQKTYSISEDDYVLYEKCDYGTIERCEAESPKEHGENGQIGENGFQFPEPKIKSGDKAKIAPADNQVPSPTEMDSFRWRFDSAASMVFHSSTGLPLTSSPAPLKRGNNCFDFDDSINGISGIKSALFHPIATPAPPPPPPRRLRPSTTGLLGSFEESALKGRLEPAATVHGFTCEIGASGAFCPPHRRLPVTVFFYAPGGTNAPYMGHINLGPGGYQVARSGTVQVSLFNPHGTLVKMFVVLYELAGMPARARTFLRQRTLYMPAGAPPPDHPRALHQWLRYLIHLRFMTSKSGKLYLHTDIRLIVSRKADLDTATAHSAICRPIANKQNESANHDKTSTKENVQNLTNRAPNRVFGGCSEFDSEISNIRETGYGNQTGVPYELRSFTYAPENPKYSPC